MQDPAPLCFRLRMREKGSQESSFQYGGFREKGSPLEEGPPIKAPLISETPIRSVLNVRAD